MVISPLYIFSGIPPENMGVGDAGYPFSLLRQTIDANLCPRAVTPTLEVLYEWDIPDLESLSAIFPSTGYLPVRQSVDF